MQKNLREVCRYAFQENFLNFRPLRLVLQEAISRQLVLPSIFNHESFRSVTSVGICTVEVSTSDGELVYGEASEESIGDCVIL